MVELQQRMLRRKMSVRVREVSMTWENGRYGQIIQMRSERFNES